MAALASCLRSVGMLAATKRTSFLNFMLLWMIILGVSSLNLNISPDHLDAGVSGAVFRVICRTDEPLTHCHFRRRDIYNNDGPVMDLSEGPDTPPATNYSYTGTGLSQGQCGVSLNRPTGVQRWVVGCRVRTKTSGWHFAHMTLFAHLKGSTALTTSPRAVTVRPGGSVSLECKAANPLVGCLFRLPDGSTLPLIPQSRISSPSTCSVTLSDVSESLNGFVWCRAWRDGYDEWRAFALTVAGPPSMPVLEVNATTYTKGDVLRVVCTVSRVLPSAYMTWYLGHKVIKQDHVNEAWTEPWRWPFELQTVRQTVTRRLETADDGQDITCGVKQVDDDLPTTQSKYTIKFYRAPSAPTVELSFSSRWLEGDILTALCRVRGGYPLAQLTWSLGTANLTTRTANLTDGVLVDTVTKVLKGEDDGKELRCVASHPSLTEPIERSATIHVEYRPQISMNIKEQFRLKVGSAGVATVEFRANPKPDIYWTVDQVTIEEGFADSTGRYEAAFLSNNDGSDPLGWVAKLFVNNVTLADLERSFFLNARNKLGEEFFRAVNFGTTEPADVSVSPTLALSPSIPDFPVGSTITATCTVQRNRPVPGIRWTLSNETVTTGVSRPILSQTNRGIYTIVQTMMVQLREADDGNQLVCNVGSWQTYRDISVIYPPRKLVPVIEQPGFTVGKPGVLSLEISANPEPTVQWEFGAINVQQGESDPSGRFRAAQLLPTSRSKWTAKLYIANVSQQDIDSDYLLTARNQAGSMTYHLVVASQPTEPTHPYDLTTTDETSTIDIDQDSTTASETDIKVMSTYSTHAKSGTPSQLNSLEANYILHMNDFSYRYLAIANTIAILVVVGLATFIYIRLLRRLSLASQNFDMDHAPICMENIYYDQMNGGGQCTLNADH